MIKRHFLAYLLSLTFLILLWEIIARIINIAVIPPPLAVIAVFTTDFWHTVFVHAALSLGRIALGLFLAVLVSKFFGRD